jgi:LysM repeat protein
MAAPERKRYRKPKINSPIPFLLSKELAMAAAIEPVENRPQNQPPQNPALNPGNRPQGYIAEPGETLEDISNQRGIPLKKLEEANPGLIAGLPVTGQVVNIPEAADEDDAIANVNSAGNNSALTGAYSLRDTSLPDDAGGTVNTATPDTIGNYDRNNFLLSQNISVAGTNNRPPLGPDQSGRIRDGITNQLALETKLNVNDPGYSSALGADSNNYRHGRSTIPDGTYRQTTPQQNRLHTTATNPIAVDQFSGDPVARVAQYDRDIATRESELKELLDRRANTFRDPTVDGTGPTADDYRAAQLSREISALKGERGTFVNNARLQSSRPEDAKMYQALGNPADANKPPIIFINGVNTDRNRSAIEALEISNELRSPVNHVVNVSSMDKLRSGIIQNGKSSGIDQNEVDLLNQQHLSGNRPAATTAANAILDQMYNGKGPIRIIGYSQGAAIGAQALRDVDAHLSQQVADGKITQQQKADMLGRVRFLGVGPAADSRHITTDYSRNEDQNGVQRALSISGHRIEQRPDLANVHYRTVSDVNDPIPQLLGVGHDNANVVRSGQVALRMANDPRSILPHLSYFEHYQRTDPGSVYNPQMRTELHNWFSGRTVEGNQLIQQPQPPRTQ